MTGFVSLFKKNTSSDLGQKIFLVSRYGDLRYGKLTDLIARTGAFFKENALEKGDRVLFASHNDWIVSILFLSCLCYGYTAVILDPNSKKRRAQALIDRTEAKLILIDQPLIEAWELERSESVVGIEPLTKSSGLRKFLKRNAVAEAYPARIETLEPMPPEPPIDGKQDAFILYTSGTTSNPKGVRISYGALWAHLVTLSQVEEYGAESRVLNMLDLSHVDGIIQGPVAAFFNGATVYRPYDLSIQHLEETLDCLHQFRITHYVTVPTILKMILPLAKQDPKAFENGCFQLVLSCGARLEQKLWESFEQLFGVRVMNMYGLTETVSGGIWAGIKGTVTDYTSVGYAVDCEVKVIDQAGKSLPAGEKGELCIKGELLMSGYFKDDSRTREVIWNEWLRTGDLATIDASGKVTILGRIKSMINPGGVYIQPDEIAEVLHLHPAVGSAVVFGEEDDFLGEKIVCAVELQQDHDLDELTLIKHCREHLEEKKIPSKVYFLATLPRGRSGKVQLEEVKKQVEQMNPTEQGAADTVAATVLEIASKVFKIPVDELSLYESSESTDGWNSLAHLELIANLEKRLSIRFDPVEIMRIRSLQDVVGMVQGKRNESQTAEI